MIYGSGSVRDAQRGRREILIPNTIHPLLSLNWLWQPFTEEISTQCVVETPMLNRFDDRVRSTATKEDMIGGLAVQACEPPGLQIRKIPEIK